MKKVTVRDLQLRTAEVVNEAAAGELIVIERRGRANAELRPFIRPKRGRRIPELTDLWSRMPAVSADSGRYLEE